MIEPYYQEPNITIYCGDCLEVMKQFEDKNFDLVLTDPPYGVDFRGSDWDAFIPKWIGEAERIGKIILFAISCSKKRMNFARRQNYLF